VELTKHNTVQLVWVTEHLGIEGNEIAQELAIEGLSHPLTGPKTILGISAKVARGVIRCWMNRKHEK
jgi:ribonuclease HI